MKYFLKYTLTGLLFLTLFSACKKEYESIEAVDQKNIEDYIQANNLSNMKPYINSDGVKTGVYYEVLTEGTVGPALAYKYKVFLTYTIKSIDGQYTNTDEGTNRYGSYLGYLTETGYGYPVSWGTTLKEIIQKRGGSIRLIIPSHLAYGRNGRGNIPGNACLDCTLKLSDKDNITDFEDDFVKKYIATIDPTTITGLTKTTTGLYYHVIAPGAGETVTLSSTITAIYSGKLTNGTVFDSNTSANPLTTSLSGVIAGWQQGVPFIKKGGKIRLIIPPALGYGPSGSGVIPGNSILDFEIELTEVKN